MDRSRPTYSPCVFENLKDGLEAFSRAARLDYWQTQPYYAEVWTEKDAIIGSVEGLTDELAVIVCACRGFASATWANNIAELFRKTEKPKMVFYLGDHDPSGRCIEREVRKRILQYGSGPFTMRRLAILAGDIERFDLPPLRVKPSVPRTVAFLGQYKNSCVELDSLPLNELRRRIRESVEAMIDWEVWNRAQVVERAQKESIERLLSAWPSPPAAGVRRDEHAMDLGVDT